MLDTVENLLQVLGITIDTAGAYAYVIDCQLQCQPISIVVLAMASTKARVRSSYRTFSAPSRVARSKQPVGIDRFAYSVADFGGFRGECPS